MRTTTTRANFEKLYLNEYLIKWDDFWMFVTGLKSSIQWCKEQLVTMA
jgi:hypothetical protein